MNKLLITTIVFAFIITAPGCARRIGVARKDNGKHKGWFKNRHNPHNPNTNNPGQQKKQNNNGNKKKFYRVNLW